MRETTIAFVLVVPLLGCSLGYGPDDAIRDLKSNDADLRSTGARYFYTHPDEYSAAAGDALIAALEKPEERFYVVQALRARGEKRAVGSLLKLLEQDPSDWYDISNALGTLGDENCVPSLLKMLQGPRLNRGAITTLGKLGDRRAVLPLLKMLEDNPGEYTILEALAMIGDKRALDPLMNLTRKALKNENEGDLLGLTRALARLADESATPLLIQLTRHTDAAVRQAAAEGLGHAGDKDAVARLREMLNSEKDRDAKTGAIVGLGICDTEETVKILSEELRRLTNWEFADEKNVYQDREATWRKNIVETLAGTRRASALVAIMGRVRAWRDVDLRWFSGQESMMRVYAMNSDLEAVAHLTGKAALCKEFGDILDEHGPNRRKAEKYLRYVDEFLTWWQENEEDVKELAAQGKTLAPAEGTAEP